MVVTLTNPQFSAIATPVAADLAADGYSWAQAVPLVVDAGGTLITLAQKHSGASKRHFWVWRDLTGTWHDNAAGTNYDGSAGEQLMERGAFVYDARQDCLHCLWITINAGDGGVIYRRYNVVRDGSGAITSITRTPGVSVILDGLPGAASIYQHPVLLFLDDAAYGAHGALLAAWSARAAGNEIRASLCVLGSSATTGSTEANWSAPLGTPSTTTTGQVPVVAYSTLVANSTPGVLYPSLTRKLSGAHAGDLYLAYHDGNNVPLTGAWRWRRFSWSSSAHNWSGAATADALICTVQRSGADGGYSLKSQLATAWHHDPVHDRMLIGLATWKSNADGDTQSIIGVGSDDTLTSLVDVASAGGAHPFAPTLDLAYDATSARLAVAYLSAADQVAVQLYDGLTPDGAPVAAFTQQPADVPLLYAGGRVGSQLPLLFRDRTSHGSTLYQGWYGTLDWSSATPPAPQPPVIASFTASPSSIMVGQAATLAWSVTGATSMTLNGAAVSGSSATRSPSTTTTYTLVATNAAGSMQQSVTVTVTPAPQPPVISSFTASPVSITAGQSTTLAWSVSGATSLTLNGSTITGSSTSVAPGSTTTYTLVATNNVGSVQQSISVTVTSAPVAPTFRKPLLSARTLRSLQRIVERTMQDSYTIIRARVLDDGAGATYPHPDGPLLIGPIPCSFAATNGREVLTDGQLAQRGSYTIETFMDLSSYFPNGTASDERTILDIDQIQVLGSVYNVVYTPPITALDVSRIVGLDAPRKAS